MKSQTDFINRIITITKQICYLYIIYEQWSVICQFHHANEMIKFQWVKITAIKRISIVLLLFGMLAIVFETDFEIWQNFVNWKCDKTYEDNAVLGPVEKQWNAKMQFWSKTNSIAAVTFHSNTFKRNCVFFRLFVFLFECEIAYFFVFYLNLRLIAQSLSCNRKIQKIYSFRWKFHQFVLLNLS